MKTDYKNWMPKGMVMGSGCSAAVFLILSIVFALAPISGGVQKVLLPILLIVTALCLFVTVWMYLMYRAFSYDGNRKMSKQIIDGVSAYVNVPDGGKGLDVGCGSGAQSFVEKLKDMGYSEVKLVDTTNGMFMSRWESTWMGLSGSAILMGRK